MTTLSHSFVPQVFGSRVPTRLGQPRPLPLRLLGHVPLVGTTLSPCPLRFWGRMGATSSPAPSGCWVSWDKVVPCTLRFWGRHVPTWLGRLCPTPQVFGSSRGTTLSHAPTPRVFGSRVPPGWDTPGRRAGIHPIRRSESLSGAEGTLVALQAYTSFYGPYRGLNEHASPTPPQQKQKTNLCARRGWSLRNKKPPVRRQGETKETCRL